MRKLTLGQLEVLEHVVDDSIRVRTRVLSPAEQEADTFLAKLRAAHTKLREGIERAKTHRRNRDEKRATSANAG